MSGVSRVFDSGENTGADLERYYSYRMEKGQTGRMLALLALKAKQVGVDLLRRNVQAREFFCVYEFTRSGADIR